MPKRSIKVGDWLAAPVKVTRLSDDGYWVTLDMPAYGTRITIPASSVEEWERLPDDPRRPR